MRCSKLGAVLLLLGVTASCGGDGDDGGGGSSSAAVSSCHQMCGAQYADCSESIPDCKQLCDVFVPSFDADCQTKAKAFYDCGAQIAWTCSGLAAQQEDMSQCQAERSAYAPCATTK